MNDLAKTGLLITGVGAFTIPLFSSGLRRNLTFSRFIYNHTIFGDFPLYVPKEVALDNDDITDLNIEFNRLGLLQRGQIDIKNFITPNDPVVQEYVNLLWCVESPVLGYWYWVCDTYEYKLEPKDYWTFPNELLIDYEKASASGIKPTYDCEDGSYLLASLLIGAGYDAFVNIGYLKHELHAWVTLLEGDNGYINEYILETTLTGKYLRDMVNKNTWVVEYNDPLYKPLFKFNDKQIIDLGGFQDFIASYL